MHIWLLFMWLIFLYEDVVSVLNQEFNRFTYAERVWRNGNISYIKKQNTNQMKLVRDTKLTGTRKTNVRFNITRTRDAPRGAAMRCFQVFMSKSMFKIFSQSVDCFVQIFHFWAHQKFKTKKTTTRRSKTKARQQRVNSKMWYSINSLLNTYTQTRTISQFLYIFSFYYVFFNFICIQTIVHTVLVLAIQLKIT